MRFRDQATKDIFEGNDSAAARRALPEELHRKASGMLERLHRATHPTDLRSGFMNRLERLKGDRQGQWSIRINVQYRICFDWENGEAVNIEIVDYH